MDISVPTPRRIQKPAGPQVAACLACNITSVNKNPSFWSSK